PPPPRAAALIADFSRFLTSEQQDRDNRYTQLLRRCFGRQVDRAFWFLMEFQSKVRDAPPRPAPELTAKRIPGA
ncbi:hypothetical protein DSD19_02805, partial [Rhodovulum sp. BSW8]|uniref:hypothetical protein n=1 Tax=Rhodovulum sp. BSW8 TaxID=2259645 RepID=UPI000E009489